MTKEMGVWSLETIPFIVKDEHTGALVESLLVSLINSINHGINNALTTQANIRPTKYTKPLSSLLIIEPKVNKHTIRKGANRKNKYNIEFKFNSILSIQWVYKMFIL